jgi:hypothetical protein
MAKTPSWQRVTAEYADSANINNAFNVFMTAVPAGTTVTRVRFIWQAQHVDDVLGEAAGFQVAAALHLIPAATDVDDVDGPWIDPNQDFLWWEAPIYGPFPAFLKTTTNGQTEICPLDQQARDARAQRLAAVDSILYFRTETSTLSPGQSEHYLSMSASVLLLT